MDVAPRSFVVSMTEFVAADAVGDLLNPGHEERWMLPSDHLPIAAQVGDVRAASWNVLNTIYMRQLRASASCLEGSTLFTENHPYEHYEAITLREHRVISSVLAALPNLDVLFLQECGPRFLDALRHRCPPGWEVLLGRNSGAMNNICALINTDQLTIDGVRSEIIESAYPLCRQKDPAMQRPIMNLVLVSAEGEELRVIHTHVPGDPTFPGLADLARYCKPFLLGSGEPVALVGDLNFCEKALRTVFTEYGLPQWRSALPGNTIFGKDGEPKQIDHILYFGEQHLYEPLSIEIFGREAAHASTLLNV